MCVCVEGGGSVWVWVCVVGVHECKLGCESDGVCVFVCVQRE